LFSSCKTEKENTDSKNNGQKKPQMTIVDAIIAREKISSNMINTTGTIIANEEVEIKSEVSGRVTKIYFKEGSPVSKGQVLVKLNDDDLIAQWNKLKIEIKLQEEKESRQKQLLTSLAISKEEYDVTLSNLNLFKANAEILKVQLDKTKIIAPFSGIIGLKSISEGAYISPSTVIASIQNINTLKLEFSVPEKYNNDIKIGSLVNFNTSASKNELVATVYAKEPKIDATTRTSKIRARFTNSENRVFPGSFADINMKIGEQQKVKMIPSVSYIPDINGAKVFVYKSGKAQYKNVVAGLRTEKEVQIISGIEEGDTVLTTGILQLKPNMEIGVNITNLGN
jgi:membrane fusion protein (multidrug efflux system)